MAIGLTIKIKNLDKAVGVFKGSEEILTRHLERAMTASSLHLLGAATRKTPKDTSRLAGSHTTFVKKTSGGLEGGVGTGVKYAPFVHSGTRPHWPPMAAITPWAKRHGIEPFLVARAIAKKGTKPHPFYEEALGESEGKIKSLFGRAVDNTEKEIAQRIG